MNKLFVLLCCVIALAANAQQDKSTPAITIREAKQGKAIILKDNNAGGVYSEIIDSAGMLMFEYNFTGAQTDGIADDEYKEIIAFNVVPDKTGRFLLKGDDVKHANAYLYKGCFCIDRGTSPITGGTIKGTRMTKTTWYINMDAQVNTNQGDQTTVVTKKIKGLFKIVPAI